MSRVASTLITGSSGEIGHGLIERLAGSGKPIITLDLNPLAPALGKLVRKEFTGSILDTQLLERVNAEYEVDCVFHLAALLSTRGRVFAGPRTQGQRRGDAEPVGVRPEGGRVARPAGDVLLPLVHRRLRPARPGHQGERGAGAGGLVQRADDHVRREQTLLRTPRPLLRPALQATLGRPPGGPGGLPRPPLPRADLGGHGPVRRHVGLRPGDDPRRGPGAAPTPASSGRTRASRSWPCRTRSRPSCGSSRPRRTP